LLARGVVLAEVSYARYACFRLSSAGVGGVALFFALVGVVWLGSIWIVGLTSDCRLQPQAWSLLRRSWQCRSW